MPTKTNNGVKFIIGTLASVMFLIVLVATIGKHNKGENAEAHADAVANTPQVASKVLEPQNNLKHPAFHVLQRKTDEVVSVVVSENTTDEQIRSLLWYLHSTVQTRQFGKLGLKPTTVTGGVPSYDAGIIDIYRGSRCARENWLNAGPDFCGYGEHQAAEYGWGGKRGPSSDDGSLIENDGTRIPVF